MFRYVEVTLDHLRIAFALEDVGRVVRAVALTPVPGAAKCLMGMLNLHGSVIPVFDTRTLFGIESRELKESDHFLLAKELPRRAFVADSIVGSFECQAIEKPKSFSTEMSHVRGVVRHDDGLVVVHDMKRFMAFDASIPLRAVHG
ncbi:MAG TPA: chemotaxis protein CheW [Ramlibacter sp.]|jgi:purine-binding chemotaxis protein CheW|nr:chemotaxis protein CheW [Ramlibacter sp.]